MRTFSDIRPLKFALLVILSIFFLCGSVVAAEEQRRCEDGNKVDGDGCSSTGEIEPGWYSCAEVWSMYTSPVFSFCQGYNLNAGNAGVLVNYDGDIPIAYCTCCVAPGCD